MRDIQQQLNGGDQVNIENDVLTADTDGVDCDLQGYEGARVIFLIGESNDTLSGSVYFVTELEESDDGITYTTVAAADLIDSNLGTVDGAADDDTMHTAGYRGSKRYIRGHYEFTGTHTNGTPLGCIIERGLPRRTT